MVRETPAIPQPPEGFALYGLSFVKPLIEWLLKDCRPFVIAKSIVAVWTVGSDRRKGCALLRDAQLMDETL
jgi:hypothetical protein